MKWLKRIGYVLTALIVLPAITLFLMGRRAGAGQIHVATEIQASPEQLWPWVDDGQRLKQWVSWLVDVKPDQRQLGVGARRIWTMKDENNGGALMEIEGTCSEYDPPRRMTVQLNVKGEFDGTQQYVLTDLGNGRTRLEVNDTFHFTDRLAQFMEPLVTPAARKKLEGDVGRLKSLVESKAELRVGR